MSEAPGPDKDQQTSQEVQEATRRFSHALAALESAVNARLEREAELTDAEAEVQRMGADRSRLAESLDAAEARSQQLEQTNREVSKRLIDAMEAIRAILDREE